MANTVQLQTIHDGLRTLIVKCNIIGDGSGEETATMLIDISTYASMPNQGTPTSCAIDKIQAWIEGFSVRLLWEADTDVAAIQLQQGETEQDFRHSGGLINNAGTGVTGDIKFTTVGLGSGDQATILLTLHKKYG